MSQATVLPEPCISVTSILQATCGAIYGVVPFTSRRSTGLACGLVSAGGAIGGVMNQGIFFLNTPASGPYCKLSSMVQRWLLCL